MIVLGNKTGAKDERHFVLKVEVRLKYHPELYSILDFDVYADTEEEVMRLLKEYIQTILPGWTANET